MSVVIGAGSGRSEDRARSNRSRAAALTPLSSSDTSGAGVAIPLLDGWTDAGLAPVDDSRKDVRKKAPFENEKRCMKEFPPGGGDGWRTSAYGPAPEGFWSSDDLLVQTLVTIHEFGDGLLIGTNQGEFGGSLWWFSHGRKEIVIDGSVFAIVSRRWGLLVLQTPGPRLGGHGMLSVLNRSRSGRWTARQILELPAAPEAYRLEGDDGLTIATDQGTVAIGRNGKVGEIRCRKLPDSQR